MLPLASGSGKGSEPWSQAAGNVNHVTAKFPEILRRGRPHEARQVRRCGRRGGHRKDGEEVDYPISKYVTILS